MDSSFIGREREIAELTQGLNRAIEGHGQIVMLAGEPGIGKTRTSQEFAEIAHKQGASVLWGRCYEQTGAPPYWPWVQAIRPYAQQADPSVLLSLMGTGAADIAEVIPEIKAKFPGLKSPPSLEPEQARFRLFDSLTAFLKNASQIQPLVLILEDLHWAERSSLLLLEFASKEIASSHLLIIGTYRDVEVPRRHPLSESLGRLVGEQTFTRLRLSGLSLPEVGSLMETESGVMSTSDVVEAVHERTEGNPLFVSQIARLISYEGGEWSGDIPQAVRDAIGLQISRLSEECTRVLTIASTIGRYFEFEVLKRVSDDSEEQLLEFIEQALETHVLEVDTGGTERYQFGHALIQQSLYEGLSPSRRIRLHAQIAQVLEEIYGDDAEAHAAELMFHFSAAEPVLGRTKLAQYSKAAGEQALASHAYEDALPHFQLALSAMQGQEMDGEKAALYFGLARAQAATVERPHLVQASDYVQSAFDYYVEVGDIARAVEIAVHQFGTIEGTNQRVARTLELVAPNSHDAGRLLSHSITLMGTSQQEYIDATEAYERALAIAHSYGDKSLEMQTLVNAACLDGSNLCVRESIEKHLQAIELAGTVDQPALEAHSRLEIVNGLYSFGELENAIPHAKASLAAADRARNRWLLASTLLANQTMSSLIGDWQKARRFNDQGLEMSPRYAALLSGRAVIEYQVGDFEQSDSYLGFLMEASTLDAQSPRGADPNVAVPLFALMSGDIKRLDLADEINSAILSKPSATPWYMELARVGLALAVLNRGDSAQAEAQYNALMPIRGRMPHVCPYISGDRLLGLLAYASGKSDLAETHFEDALEFCRKAGYSPELAWACHDYADILIELASSGSIRSTRTEVRNKVMILLDEALAISDELEMLPLNERANLLRANLESIPRARGRPTVTGYPGGLTSREVEVLRLIAQGKTNQEIANGLFISPKTVANHVTSVYTKTDSNNRVEATAFAVRHGLISFS